MKIATYNLRFGGGKTRTHWMDILASVQPDIFLVQETCDPKLYLNQDFYQGNQERIVWQPVENRSWGSALYFTRGVVEPIAVPGFGGWVVGVQVRQFGYLTRPDRLLRVFSVHAPRPAKSSYFKEVHKILEFIISSHDDAHDLVIGGDFNLSVSISPREQPYVWEIKDWRTRVKRELGLINCWQAANPNCQLPQTLRWSGDLSYPYHCDGIFAPASWYRYLKSSEVLITGWEAKSDHNPVVASFEVPEEKPLVPAFPTETD
jgi:endonuclease/exonuclease/phosphatase family metal-dependent hydrolase